MNHSTWRTRRTRQLAGEPVEYDQEYVDARLAGMGPTLPLLRRLAKALDGSLLVAMDEGDSPVTFTPHNA